MPPIRIIFMGTPEFAVASLDMLVRNGEQVIAVVTAPDRPAGRGLETKESAVKRYALQHGLKILQPAKLKDPLFLGELRSLKADLQVVVAFRMLPEAVWDMPGLGTINLHGSLLPQYRGAAPINWAIINGEKETGLTTFKLRHEIDTGNIIYSEKIPIGADETAGELHDRMMNAGARLLLKTVKAIAAGEAPEMPQDAGAVNGTGDASLIRTAPKIFKEDGRINWNDPVEKIYNLIRGLSPYPAAWTLLQGKTVKIFRARKEPAASLPAAGSMETDNRTYLKFAAADGWIHLTEVRQEGKKRMTIEEFLRGWRP